MEKELKIVQPNDPISHEDQTGTTVVFTAQKVAELIFAMPPAHRRYSTLLAQTVKTPHEIWWAWEKDPVHPGSWLLFRTYVSRWSFEAEADQPATEAATISRFIYDKQWQLAQMEVFTGHAATEFETELNQKYRHGRLLYSQSKNAG